MDAIGLKERQLQNLANKEAKDVREALKTGVNLNKELLDFGLVLRGIGTQQHMYNFPNDKALKYGLAQSRKNDTVINVNYQGGKQSSKAYKYRNQVQRVQKKLKLLAADPTYSYRDVRTKQMVPYTQQQLTSQLDRYQKQLRDASKRKAGYQFIADTKFKR